MFIKSVVSLVENRGVKRVRLLVKIEGMPQDIINSKNEGWGKHFDLVNVKSHFYGCEKYDGSIKRDRRNEWETWSLPREGGLISPSFEKTPPPELNSNDVDEDVEMVER